MAQMPGPVNRLFRGIVGADQAAERTLAAERLRTGAGGRSPRLQLGFAVVGVAVGFALLVLPGVLMLRRVRAWRAAEVPTPGIAGPLGAAALWAGVAAVAWSAGWGLIGILVSVLAGLPSMVVASRG